MKKVAKVLSLVLILVLTVGCFAACGKKDEAAQGKVLNIYCWNEEFKERVEKLYPGYTKDSSDSSKGKIGDVTVVWNITPNANNAYQNALDEALRKQKDAKADDKVNVIKITTLK